VEFFIVLVSVDFVKDYDFDWQGEEVKEREKSVSVYEGVGDQSASEGWMMIVDQECVSRDFGEQSERFEGENMEISTGYDFGSWCSLDYHDLCEFGIKTVQ
jgi:hypothetical protein